MKRVKIHSWMSVYYFMSLCLVSLWLGEVSVEAKHPFQRLRDRFCHHFCHDCNYKWHKTNHTILVIEGEDLKAAIRAANPGDTIEIGPGTFVGPFLIDKDLTLIGSGQGVTILTGSNSVRVLEIKGDKVHVTIEDLTITAGVAHQGAGIFSKCHTLKLHRLDVINNRLSDPSTITGGGGIFSHNQELHIHHSNISNNSAGIGQTSRGGGIFDKSQRVVIKTSLIDGNQASLGGAGILWEGQGAGVADVVDIEIDESTISNNICLTSFPLSSGAGMNFTANGQTSILIRNCQITGNQAMANNFSTFTGTSRGGGIFLVGPLTVDIKKSQVNGNAAVGFTGSFGGGIYVSHEAILNLKLSEVTGNRAGGAGNGGGIFVVQNGTFHNDDSVVEGNIPNDVVRE